MPRDGPIGSLRRSFGDRDHVAQPAGTVEPSPRMSACASGSQIRCELFTERPAGLDEQGPIDRLVRHMHLGTVRMLELEAMGNLLRGPALGEPPLYLRTQPWVACQLRRLRSARQARYRFRDPLATTSREMVEGARFSRLAIALNESPAFNPREISSRSPTVSRSGERTRRRGG